MSRCRSKLAALKIVSGGQTGADRAALDWAIASGLPHGGWCPKGRWSEDGPIATKFCLHETPLSNPVQRTEWNVRDSDATVIFSIAQKLSGGSRRTLELARKLGKPCLHVRSGEPKRKAIAGLRAFLREHAVKVLNVAGPRASQEPAVGRFVQRMLKSALEK